MESRPVPVELFVECIAKWHTALIEGRFTDARHYADEIGLLGQLLTFDPEFRRLFSPHAAECGTEDVDHALRCVRGFLRAVGDASEPGRFRQRAPLPGSSIPPPADPSAP